MIFHGPNLAQAQLAGDFNANVVHATRTISAFTQRHTSGASAVMGDRQMTAQKVATLMTSFYRFA